MRKLLGAVLVIALSIGLCACNRAPNTERDHIGEITTITPEPTITDFPVESKSICSSDKTSVSAKMNRSIVKDGNILFSKTNDRIISLDLSNQKDTTLYQASKPDTILDYYLYKDWIYVLEVNYDSEVLAHLYRINKDGTDKKLLLDDLKDYESQIYVYQNNIYLVSGEKRRCYKIEDDGSLGNRIADEQSVYQYLPEGYSELFNNDKILDVPYCMEHFHCIWATDEEGGLFCVNPSDGSIRTITLPNDSQVIAITDAYIISMDYGDEDTFYLTDIKTGKSTLWFRGNADYLDYDETGCYFDVSTPDGDMNMTHTYKKITWDGTETALFTVNQVAGMYKETFEGVTDFTVIENQIYYYYADTDKMYLMYRKVSSPSQVTELGTCYMDKMFAALGHAEAYHEDAYAKADPDRKIANIYSERFVMDCNTRAAIKINKTMEKLQKKDNEDFIILARRDEDGFIKNSMAPYALTSLFMGFTFLSDEYICIYQYDYENTGGAHGMPYKKYYVFNLKTGDQLKLKDIIQGTQKEVHDKILAFFTDYISEHKGEVDGYAADTVDQTAGFDSPFYLTREGIGFYYPPYDLACYAAGFQDVIIPYSAFDMLIDTNGGKSTDVSSEIGLY